MNVVIDRAARKFIEHIKQWANENYEKSYGASCIVECMTDEEILEFRSIADAKRFAKLKDEQFMSARNQ